MKLSTKLTIAQLLNAAGSVLTALGTEMSGGDGEAAATPEAPKTRGRKPAPPAEKTEDPKPEEKAEEKSEEAGSSNGTGKTYEDMRALIEPVIKGGQGAEVKKVIAKYSQTGLKDMDPKHYKAFETDIIALSY